MLAMPRRSVRHIWAFVVSATMCAGCFGRNHTLHEGTYEFTVQEVIRDECGIQSGSALGSGSIRISGDLVRVQLDERIYNMEAVGYFLANVERFTLDGSAGNVPVQVNGSECLVTLVQAHLEATTDSPSTFHGASQILFNSDQPGCFCQLWARFTAQRL
jgi:hypothetical protein